MQNFTSNSSYTFQLHFWNAAIISEMKLKFPLFNVELNVSREESDAERRRRKYRNTRKQPSKEPETDEGKKEPKETKKPAPDQVMMVKVENMVHEKFQQTEEVKAATQEVIKTIRDIINLNPLYRWVCLVTLLIF